jgi:hypothetical protein
MAYTSQNLADVEAAIINLAAGRRVVSVTIEGKSIAYGQAQLPELKQLKAEIVLELQTTTSRRFFLAQTDKGL